MPLALLWLTACSTRNYYEPETIAAAIGFDGELPEGVAQTAQNGAVLANGQVVTESGVETRKIPKGYRLVNRLGDTLILSSACKNVLIGTGDDANWTVIDKFHYPLAAATLTPAGKLAYLLEDNSYGLYDLQQDKVIVNHTSDTAMAVDAKIANPRMLENLLVMPTLDGKMVILDGQSGEKIREIAIGNHEFFNNIVFMQIVSERLIAATPWRIVSVGSQFINGKNFEIRDVKVADDRVYVATKDGNIIWLDLDLTQKGKRKFQFAHFIEIVPGKRLHLIEKEGYLISLDYDLADLHVYKLPGEIDKKLYVTDRKILFDDQVITYADGAE